MPRCRFGIRTILWLTFVVAAFLAGGRSSSSRGKAPSGEKARELLLSRPAAYGNDDTNSGDPSSRLCPTALGDTACGCAKKLRMDCLPPALAGGKRRQIDLLQAGFSRRAMQQKCRLKPAGKHEFFGRRPLAAMSTSSLHAARVVRHVFFPLDLPDRLRPLGHK